MNPIVLAFHFSIVVLFALSVWWVYFKDGAEFIENHPGLFQNSSYRGRPSVTADQIKTMLPIMIASWIIALGVMWFIEF